MNSTLSATLASSHTGLGALATVLGRSCTTNFMSFHFFARSTQTKPWLPPMSTKVPPFASTSEKS